MVGVGAGHPVGAESQRDRPALFLAELQEQLLGDARSLDPDAVARSPMWRTWKVVGPAWVTLVIPIPFSASPTDTDVGRTAHAVLYRVRSHTACAAYTTSNWVIMSWSSCDALWQWITKRPRKLANCMITDARTFGPSQITSFQPRSAGSSGRPATPSTRKRTRWMWIGCVHPPAGLTRCQISAVFTRTLASIRLRFHVRPLTEK